MVSVKDAIASVVKNIEIQTGKKIDHWISSARNSGFSKHGEILKWLKEKHAIGHGYANFIAKEALRPDEGTDDDLVASQFAGAKSALLPIYDELLLVLLALGKDVSVEPKKHNVSIRRNKQFALLQPSTSIRLDVGLILKGVAATGRLEKSGSFNAMFTHRVRIISATDIDAELKRWFKTAYAAA